MALRPASTIFISGGARGIGAATARLFAGEGHRVIIADIDEAAAQALAAELGEGALAVSLDVRSPQSWEQALDAGEAAFGSVDVLVNNAGVLKVGYALEVSPADMEAMAQVNLLGFAHGLRAGVRRFLAKSPDYGSQGVGHHIGVCSLASFTALRGQAFYSATKHAMRAYEYGAAMELKGRGVRFSLVHPGAVETDMLHNQEGHEASALAFAEATIRPETIAQAIHKAAQTGRREITVPALPGFFARIIGVFPGLLSAALSSAWDRGLRRMHDRPAPEGPQLPAVHSRPDV